MPPHTSIDTIICGIIYRETIINKLDQIILDCPGGNALYTASGYLLFKNNIGVVSKTDQEFLEKFRNNLEDQGFNTEGIKPFLHPVNIHKYYRILSKDKWETTRIKRHFYELGYEIPKYLLQFENPTNFPKSSKEVQNFSLLSTDFPQDYTNAKAVFLAPLNYQSHYSCIPFLRSSGVKTILMRSSPTYMRPGKLYEISKLLSGIDYFFTTENEIRSLYKTRFNRFGDMLDGLKEIGVPICVIKMKDHGYLLMNPKDTRLCRIPDFEVYDVDPIGVFDCFCGAFTASLLSENLTIEECASNAGAAASICREGSGINYILNTFPAILKIRAELIKREIRYNTIASITT